MIAHRNPDWRANRVAGDRIRGRRETLNWADRALAEALVPASTPAPPLPVNLEGINE